MTYQGTIQNGVVVLTGGAKLPEGATVTVVPVPTEGRDHDRSIWEKFEELARWAESQPCDLPSDLARNHDYYLHGLPKRS
ncbi:MAG TPA: hypothetical protein VF278_14705 [Pirellulales bacterium]